MKKAGVITLIFLLFAACSPEKYGTVEYGGELGDVWRGITKNNPHFAQMAEEISIREAGAPENEALGLPLIKIRLYKYFHFAPPAMGEFEVRVLIGRSVRVPITAFDDTETNASEKDILDGTYQTDIPKNIEPPLKGLSFVNLYPGDAGYGLIENVEAGITLSAEMGKKARRLAENWIASVAEQFRGSNEGAAEERTVWLGAVGDIMPGRGVQDILIGRNDGLDKIFSDTLSHLRNVDFLIGNLEGALTSRRTRVEKSYNFKFDHRVLTGLKDAGFDYLSVTNNHCFDYGMMGFTDTLDYLDEYEVETSGAGKDLAEALAPSIFSRGGESFRILSVAAYPPERSQFDGRRETEVSPEGAGVLWPGPSLFEALEGFTGDDSIDIVYVHGGREWSSLPIGSQKDLYRKFADYGADIVIGSHPHVLQPVESYGGAFIAYSLGNFIFPGMEETRFGEESMILKLGFYRNRLIYINYIPVRINGKYLSIDASGTIIERFKSLNEEFVP